MPATRRERSSTAEVVYLSNLFPSAVEPYVGEEIDELQRRSIRVTACSVWSSPPTKNPDRETLVTVFTWWPVPWLVALLLCIHHSAELKDLFCRLIARGGESWRQRARGIAHTVLGARLASLLRHKNVRHIHIHHGCLAAWIGMVAARLLHVPYSLTLHGSDLLVRPTFLDLKLQHCKICFTVSEFNRNFLLRHYPQIDPSKVLVQRIGVSVPSIQFHEDLKQPLDHAFTLLAVGRLHAVKDHAFLIRACAGLKASGNRVLCCIAGEGPERRYLQTLIHNLGLASDVQLLGHIPRNALAALYVAADLVVLTSQSEGLPLTLIEAMALGRTVLAPGITGIPELVLDGKTGFLYKQGSITDFVDRVEFIQRTYSAHAPVRKAARAHVQASFNLESTLHQFSDVFVQRILGERENEYADSVLQQVQL